LAAAQIALDLRNPVTIAADADRAAARAQQLGAAAPKSRRKKA
jgi:hypothetical protein